MERVGGWTEFSLLFSSVLVVMLCLLVLVDLCLSITFMMVMKFTSLLMPFLVLMRFSSWAYLPVPRRGWCLANFRQSLRMCLLVWVGCPHGQVGSLALMNLLWYSPKCVWPVWN